ncbi:T9SS type A sorting domain-containing protein [Flavobacterium terrisoli]|uniref:T9SS type A sorting domain-containing protein n=1 Tax=Flavobacterium terrisoli TaxID=3242195 RepID=UPI002543A92A|nr:T9SS type A sorting domain-containing protein [Flavobacterium buctense]
MKKIYSLLFFAVTTLSFGQVLTDDFNYADNSLLTANGWVAHSGTTNFIDVGASNGLSYPGYNTAANNAARLDNTGEDVNKSFAAPVTSGTLYYSFLVNVASGDAGYFTHLGTGTNFAARIFVKPSANAGKINFGISNTGTASFAAAPTDFDLNTTYLIIVKYDVSATGAASIWVKSAGVPATEAAAGTPEHTTSASGVASIAGVYLRQYVATQNITLDEIKVYTTWFGAAGCPLSLGSETAACDAVTLNLDTYSVSIPFTGGNSGAYNLSTNAGTIGGDNPSTTESGSITISGVTEGTNVTLTVSGACGLTKTVTAPECKPISLLPYYEPFAYAEASNLGQSQQWSNVNTGDNIIVAGGLLTPAYPGLSPSTTGYAIFGADGMECSTPFTPTTTGTVYYSFIMNVNSMAGVTDANGGYFATLGSSSTTFGATLWSKRVDDGVFNLGIEVRTANAANTTYDTTALVTGTTYFVVVGYTFGPDASDDTVSLWINPTVDGAQPAATITDTHTGTDLTGISNFILRQDSATETPSMSVDELRIGTTWAQVTNGTLGTSQNNISGLKVYPNPVVNGTLYIETAANTERTVTVYDVLGKQVLNTVTSDNAINVSNLRGGVYVVKITEEGKTATRKLVIK